MKKIMYIAMSIVLSLAACQKEKIQLNIPNGAIYMDKKSLSFDENFANYPSSTTEIIVDLKINITGAPQNYDRSYQWVAQDSSTAVLGKDYEFVSNNFVVKAGELKANVQIRLKRNADLGAEKTMLYLKLVPGKDFQTEIKGFPIISTIALSNQVNRPLYWDAFAYEYFDEYSEKKFRILQDVAGMPEDALSKEPESDREFQLLIGKLKRWGILLKRYLNEQRANGTPVLEADGSPMIHGYYLD